MDTLLHEVFGDDFHIIIIRLLIALALSGFIGFERELNNHSAGFRTHILVGVGSCLMMLLSLYGFSPFIEAYDNVRFDPARIPSYVISGIGFLGAGTIIVYGGTIRGLTTAASIWTVAGIGLVVGVGMYGAAALATLIILISLIFLNNFEKILPRINVSSFIEIIVEPELEIKDVVATAEKFGETVRNIEIIKMENNIRKIHIKLIHGKNSDRISMLDEISKIDFVNNVSELDK
ncbi:MgtC/SapB family protein [Oceanobacillus chungangensis]|uniref:ATPase n=1 Tax=Oceanobacillus chungangensis TaxID=1229152 RepID=A0A3D8PTQ5_9BACI|nr:MgtC/SapB family protein [Oceanobacillus chungangensis]RDW18529.1 ATPase [Oceanobacillus chungangensis]